jgi:hypothetical protein
MDVMGHLDTSPEMYAHLTLHDGVAVGDACKLRTAGVTIECIGGDHRPFGLASDIAWAPGEAGWRLNHFTQPLMPSVWRRMNEISRDSRLAGTDSQPHHSALQYLHIPEAA